MPDNENIHSDQPLVYGVPSSSVASALRQAGLDEEAVTAILGRAIARSAGAETASSAVGPVAGSINPGQIAGAGTGSGIGPIGTINPGTGITPGVLTSAFVFQVQISEIAPECALTYRRVFVHPDVIDGVTVVQGGQTPDEMGFNARFHAIEAEFDAVSRDLQIASNCIAELRREIFQMARELEAKITEIDARIDAKDKDKESKEGKESKESKDKDTKEAKDKDTKEGKDKEGKDHKDTKEKDTPEKFTLEKLSAGLEKNAAAEKLSAVENIVGPLGAARAATSAMTGPATSPGGTEHTFIAPEDRPDVQAAALAHEGERAPTTAGQGTSTNPSTVEASKPTATGKTAKATKTTKAGKTAKRTTATQPARVSGQERSEPSTASSAAKVAAPRKAAARTSKPRRTTQSESTPTKQAD